MTEPDVSVFSHNPSWLVMGLTLEGFVVYGIILLVRDPDVVSVNGVIFGALLTATSVGVIPLIHRFWRCSLTFRISKERLVVVHQFLRTSHEVEWSSIVAVETVPQSLLAWGAALRFSRIVVQRSNEFVFAPHLQRYPVFLEELKARAMNCKAFTPQVIAGIVNKSP